MALRGQYIQYLPETVCEANANTSTDKQIQVMQAKTSNYKQKQDNASKYNQMQANTRNL